MTPSERPRSVSHLPLRDERVLLTVEEVAALLSVPPSWLKRRVADHVVVCTRLGRHVRFTQAQVAAIVQAAEQPIVSAPLTGLTRRSRRPA